MPTAPIASGFKSHLLLPAVSRSVFKGVSRTVVFQTSVCHTNGSELGFCRAIILVLILVIAMFG